MDSMEGISSAEEQDGKAMACNKRSYDPGGWRVAIIDADSMLDEVVAKLGYKGDTLEERLKNAVEYQFPSLENAWRAHQISDFLKEDSSYVLTREVAEQTIEIYRTIFTETGIIL